MSAADELVAEAQQVEALLYARAYLYGLFHKLLGGAPDAEVLDVLLGPDTADAVEAYAAESEPLAGLLAFLETLRAEERSDLLERARDEYTRVLIGPAALPASPYESPYRGAHDESLFQENTLTVRRLYHARGLRVKREQAVPDDHVALLCAFAARLATRTRDAFAARDADALAAGLRDQAAFFARHLDGWLDTYARAVRNSKAGSQAVLYPQLIEALAAFVAADAVFLGEAAFWAEWLDGELPVVDALPPGTQTALAGLDALRPFGIEDNELVELEGE